MLKMEAARNNINLLELIDDNYIYYHYAAITVAKYQAGSVS